MPVQGEWTALFKGEPDRKYEVTVEKYYMHKMRVWGHHEFDKFILFSSEANGKTTYKKRIELIVIAETVAEAMRKMERDKECKEI